MQGVSSSVFYVYWMCIPCALGVSSFQFWLIAQAMLRPSLWKATSLTARSPMVPLHLISVSSHICHPGSIFSSNRWSFFLMIIEWDEMNYCDSLQNSTIYHMNGWLSFIVVLLGAWTFSLKLAPPDLQHNPISSAVYCSTSSSVSKLYKRPSWPR